VSDEEEEGEKIFQGKPKRKLETATPL